MSDPQSAAPPQAASDTRLLVIICYALFILVFTNGLTSIVGVVLAYVKRADARGTIWESHFTNLIHVFWTGFVFFVVFFSAALFGVAGLWHTAITDNFAAPVLVLPLLGAVFVVYVVWYLYRIVRGLLFALENKAYA
ncbi:MAG TPA: hypothetical protein VGH02_07025 [Rhizomicrobium sp.]|jgi:uncharacterized membrane protein